MKKLPQSCEQKVEEECIHCGYTKETHPIKYPIGNCDEFVLGEIAKNICEYCKTSQCGGLPDHLKCGCSCHEGATKLSRPLNPCGCDNNQLECSRRREEAYGQGFKDGKQHALFVIAEGRGWEESYDECAEKLGLPLKYKK